MVYLKIIFTIGGAMDVLYLSLTVLFFLVSGWLFYPEGTLGRRILISPLATKPPGT